MCIGLSVCLSIGAHDAQLTQPSALERSIHLPRDALARRNALRALHTPMLRDAETFLRARTQSLDLATKYASLEQATTASGDFVVRVLEVMPLIGVRASVQRVYDALRFFFFNMDLSLTESSGELVVREDSSSDSSSEDVMAQRLLRTTASGEQVETNCVVAGRCSADAAGRDVAVIAVHSVASDALHPYDASARVRQDVTVALLVHTVPLRSTDAHECGDSRADIVITRAYASRLHCAERVVPQDVLDTAVVVADMCSKEILRTVYDVVQQLQRD